MCQTECSLPSPTSMLDAYVWLATTALSVAIGAALATLSLATMMPAVVRR